MKIDGINLTAIPLRKRNEFSFIRGKYLYILWEELVQAGVDIDRLINYQYHSYVPQGEEETEFEVGDSIYFVRKIGGSKISLYSETHGTISIPTALAEKKFKPQHRYDLNIVIHETPQGKVIQAICYDISRTIQEFRKLKKVSKKPLFPEPPKTEEEAFREIAGEELV